MNYINFKNIEYLKNGNEIQQKSYKILKENKILEILSKYDPLLVGTIPINLDIDSSDLDIVCKVEDFEDIKKILLKEFNKYNDFKIKHDEKEKTLVCNFKIDNMEIEIYSSNTNTEKSNGYKHMLIEYKILNLAPQKFKDKIIDLKLNGFKTEPAFGKVLKLVGNPYEELLRLEKLSEKKLKILINNINL